GYTTDRCDRRRRSGVVVARWAPRTCARTVSGWPACAADRVRGVVALAGWSLRQKVVDDRDDRDQKTGAADQIAPERRVAARATFAARDAAFEGAEPLVHGLVRLVLPLADRGQSDVEDVQGDERGHHAVELRAKLIHPFQSDTERVAGLVDRALDQLVFAVMRVLPCVERVLLQRVLGVV